MIIAYPERRRSTIGKRSKYNRRNNSYTVLLSDQEFRNLRFCSEMNDETMADVLRNGLEDYFWKTISLSPIFDDENEDEDEENRIKHISLERYIHCPYCGVKNRIDFEDHCVELSEDRLMGTEITYSFDWSECFCTNCGKQFGVYGYISEYPVSAYNSEDITIEEYYDIDEEEEE